MARVHLFGTPQNNAHGSGDQRRRRSAPKDDYAVVESPPSPCLSKSTSCTSPTSTSMSDPNVLLSLVHPPTPASASAPDDMGALDVTTSPVASMASVTSASEHADPGDIHRGEGVNELHMLPPESRPGVVDGDLKGNHGMIASYPDLTRAVTSESMDLHMGDLGEDYKRGSWTAKEDELLIAGIKQFGYGRWKEIASLIPGRKGKQLKQRWDNTLASKYVDTEWLQSKVRGDDEHDIDVEGSAPPSPKDNSAAESLLRGLQSAGDLLEKITEKARQGNSNEAIETLLSRALLGSINSASSSSSPPLPSSPLSACGTSNTIAATTAPSTAITATPTTITPATASVLSNTHHEQDKSSHENDANANHTANATASSLFADAAALALYAQQLQPHAHPTPSAFTSSPDQTSSSASQAIAALANHPYFLSNPFVQAGGDSANNAVAAAAAAAAAMAAMASSAHASSSDTVHRQDFALGHNGHANRPAPRAARGQKRRRSDPALADTQSAAMSIYASAAPITTTVNNQQHTVYPCLFPNCGKTFARLYNLKSHSRTHTDDRPFTCPVCETAFSRNHDLKRHSKIHGGDKPHRCMGCQKTFSRLDALKRHKSNQRNKATCANG